MAAAGTTDPVIGPADVTVSEGKNTIVYAWGSLDDDNLELGRSDHRWSALQPGRRGCR